MSYKLINLAFRNRELRGNARLTLLVLADHANDDGYCWPSHTTIARKVNISRRSVIRIINTLEAGGYLERNPRYIQNKRKSNGYQLSESVMLSKVDVSK